MTMKGILSFHCFEHAEHDNLNRIKSWWYHFAEVWIRIDDDDDDDDDHFYSHDRIQTLSDDHLTGNE